MIAFDDSALARLVIAAGAVPPDRRGAWLVEIAARLEGRAPCSPASLRVRRRRERLRQGLAVFQIEAELYELSDFLVAKGFLAGWNSENRDEIRKALQEFLKQAARYG